jgi:hypothetical protein
VLCKPIHNSKGGLLSFIRWCPPFFVLIVRFGNDLLVARDGAAR